MKMVRWIESDGWGDRRSSGVMRSRGLKPYVFLGWEQFVADFYFLKGNGSDYVFIGDELLFAYHNYSSRFKGICRYYLDEYDDSIT